MALALGLGVSVAMPGAAYANAGLPMLAVVWPGMGIALLPVIAIETVLDGAGRYRGSAGALLLCVLGQ